jgi:predicted sulfurtransferase
MPCQVAAFYQFTALPDFRELRESLRALCAELRLKGSVLLAPEGMERVAEADSRWRGECFVFDDRVALGRGLRERAMERHGDE